MINRKKTLNLPDSPRTKVFRAVEDILRNDPVLKQVLGLATRPQAFRSWSGEPTDVADFSKTGLPALRITPFAQNEQYWYPNQMKGNLAIQFEIHINSNCIDDVDNLFYAIERALVPKLNADRLANEAKLKAAGAMLGQCHFTQPAVVHEKVGEGGTFRALGTLLIEVKTT